MESVGDDRLLSMEAAQDTATAYDKIFDFEAPGTPIESAGSWNGLVRGLVFDSADDLKKYIQGKRVLDVGSGMGGLFKEAKIKGVDTTIININPRFAIPGHVAEAHEMYELMSEEVPANIKEINSDHDRSSIAALSDHLSFVDSSFGVIIDNKGAIYHCIYEDQPDEIMLINTVFKPSEGVLEETVDEYLRVLEPGGRARIGGLPDEPHQGIKLFRDMLDKKGIKYKVIENIQEGIVAVEITK